jgi:hypothetical protein
MIDVDITNCVYASCIELSKAVTKQFGYDKGLAVFDAIGKVIGADHKNQIFLKLLKGEVGVDVHFQATEESHIIPVVRAICASSGLNLTDSKTLFEQSKIDFATVNCSSANIAYVLIEDLIAENCVVNAAN